MNNSSFFKRFLAFILDMIIVSIISTVIYSLVNSVFDFKTPITQEYVKSVESITNSISDIDREKATAEEIDNAKELIGDLSTLAKDNYKDITIEGIPNSLIKFVITIVYFVIVAFYLKGQTFGKKLLNIKVVKEDGSLVTINQLLLRSIIICSLYETVIDLIFVFVLDNDSYYKLHSVLSGIAFAIVFISGILVIFNKDKKGLHDLISKTKVVIDE